MTQFRSEPVAWIASGLAMVGAVRLWVDGDPVWALLVMLVASVLAGILAFHRWTELRDAAERRAAAAHQALAASRSDVPEGWAEIAKGLPLPLFACDRSGMILAANAAANRFFDCNDCAGVPLISVTLSAEMERLVIDTVREGSPLSEEVRLAYPSPRQGLAFAWRDELRPGLGYLAFVETTEVHQLERVRQDFVANVSHELRTPLASIRAVAETLLEEPDADREMRERFLGKIIQEVDRLTQISRDLLVLSAAESNPVRKQECDLAILVRNIVAESKTRAEQGGLCIEYEGPKHLLLGANNTQIYEVVANLVDNAIKYSNEGAITVRLEDQGDEAVLTVSDQGIGIPSEHLDRIFERFYRVDKGRSRASGGTGLGLSIVKHIVEAHGGKVSVQSRLGEGSTFTVRLPKDAPAAKEA
ncbi:MAG: ATP-binding protein [Fimbriimonadales bacterium]